jgi:hypothetical protein
MRLGIERECHRKAERDCGDKDRQDPFGRVVSGHDRRAYLDEEPRNYCIADRDAINLLSFQLTEEQVHLGLRRLRSIVYLGHRVEPGTGSAKP